MPDGLHQPGGALAVSGGFVVAMIAVADVMAGRAGTLRMASRTRRRVPDAVQVEKSAASGGKEQSGCELFRNTPPFSIQSQTR
ncbi:hypothetical protein GOB93_14515 [Acetobacter musti]|uniref:Uncharacterized protein n=1 Tax=Acetobacter musti TaxID=864732 RepID=A0ABX0JQU3_9PROT|nr:hypothetical protein [Acetobacter musti]NHN85846.1 hypothetical protein [Acetobacter musti]